MLDSVCFDCQRPRWINRFWTDTIIWQGWMCLFLEIPSLHFFFARRLCGCFVEWSLYSVVCHCLDTSLLRINRRFSVHKIRSVISRSFAPEMACLAHFYLDKEMSRPTLGAEFLETHGEWGNEWLGDGTPLGGDANLLGFHIVSP